MKTIDYEKDVKEFHEKFGPFTIEQQQAAVEEKSKELAIAILQGDRVAIARECVDVIYAIYGILEITGDGIRNRDSIDTTNGIEAARVVLDYASDIQTGRDHCLGPFVYYCQCLVLSQKIPLPEVWREVHAANMRKVRDSLAHIHVACDCLGFDFGGNGNHELDCAIRRAPRFGKPTKPPGWVGPDVAGVLGVPEPESDAGKLLDRIQELSDEAGDCGCGASAEFFGITEKAWREVMEPTK